MNTYASRLPPSAGLGLKPEHYRDALDCRESGLWFEVHPENYMVDGGPRLDWLEAVRRDHALSFHGVGASLGSGLPLDEEHLGRLAALVERFDPHQISEHAAWSADGGVYHADLLPLPRTREALDVLTAAVDRYQTALGRRILLENPTHYLPFVSELDEPEFMVEVARRSGCGILLDVNNVYISSRNTGIDPIKWIAAIPSALIGEIHIAGHDPDAGGTDLLIDTHGAPVAPQVWDLLARTLAMTGPRPVLLERDQNIPDFPTLRAECAHAQTCLDRLPDLHAATSSCLI